MEIIRLSLRLRARRKPSTLNPLMAFPSLGDLVLRFEDLRFGVGRVSRVFYRGSFAKIKGYLRVPLKGSTRVLEFPKIKGYLI